MRLVRGRKMEWGCRTAQDFSPQMRDQNHRKTASRLTAPPPALTLRGRAHSSGQTRKGRCQLSSCRLPSRPPPSAATESGVLQATDQSPAFSLPSARREQLLLLSCVPYKPAVILAAGVWRVPRAPGGAGLQCTVGVWAPSPRPSPPWAQRGTGFLLGPS